MIYFDYAATTPIDEEVLNTYCTILKTYYGNSDSLHDMGRESGKLMEQSRANIAQLFHVYKDEILFTSCASEANNYAIKAFALKNRHRGNHLITSCVEHSSVAQSMKQLEENFGFEVTYLPVDCNGQVSFMNLKQALRKDTILVSIMMVNNETGSVNPITQYCDYVHKNSRAMVHSDCVQALGKLDINVRDLDMATFSAHKIYGLKGSGLLYKKKNIELLPWISAGQQELGLRGGTSNAPVNIVFAKTLRLALEKRTKRYLYVDALHQKLRRELSEISDVEINSPKDCSPYILNVSILSVGSEIMLNALNAKGFAVSAQSTCASKSKAISHVLLAMGKSERHATHAIRISLSHLTTIEETDALTAAIKEIIHDYRTN